MHEIFDLLARIQQKRNVQLLIIGAWALQAHGYGRNTNDIDCMTAVQDDEAIGEELIRAGFECFEELPAFRRFRHRLEPLMVLDVMRVDGATFAKMHASAAALEIEGLHLWAPSLRHLIALKLHAARNERRTDKDMNDVRELLRANPGSISPVELRELCDQFGAPDLARRLAEFL